MTKCKPPIFGDSAVLKKGLWVTLVIALVLAQLGNKAIECRMFKIAGGDK